MCRKILGVFLFIILQIPAFAGFEFIPNGGQWHPNVLYKAAVPSGSLFLEEDGLKYAFYDGAFFYNMHTGEPTGDTLKFHAYKIKFVNALVPEIEKHFPTEGVINYFLGDDPSRWAAGLVGGQEIYYKNVWENIDFKIYNRAGDLKYDFIVHPGGNPNDIQFEIEGLDKLRLRDGQLIMETSLGTLIDDAPISFQRGKGVIQTKYILEGNRVRFWLADYDASKILTIDPTLIFSTYSGSEANNFGFTATYDEKGYLYAGGSVFDQGYPTTVGAYDVTFNSYAQVDGFGSFSGWYWGISDIGITKYNLNGTARIYSTYIGGSHCEVPHSLVVNSKDELFVLGTTSSSDYPTSSMAFDKSFGGGTPLNLARGIFVNYTEGADIVVSRLSANGSQLLSSTFVGGSKNDGLNINVDLVANYADQMRGEIILDESENVVVGSSTASNDFPVTVNAFQNTYGGGAQDGVVFKMNEDLSVMLWSSFYGGNDADGIYSIIKSNSNSLYMAGGTRSANLSLPAGAYQSSYQGGITDGFYVQMDENGSNLLSGSYFGSDAYDQIYFIRQDRGGQIYVYGQSDKYGTYWIQNAAYNIPNSGQFISKFAPNEQSLEWSTTFGSGNNMINISPTAFMVDLCNKVYLSGWGSPSSGFDRIGGNVANGTDGMEVTSDAFKLNTDNNDFYLMVLEDDASALVYGSFFGGNLSSEHVDGGTSRFDRKGVMYQSVCAGCGGNDDFPIFPSNVVGPTNNGVFVDFNGNEYDAGCNNGVFKFDFGIPNIIADFEVPPTLCAPASIDFQDNSKTQNSTTWLWDFGDGTFSTDTNPSHVYATPGNYVVKLVISDPIACNLQDSISREITVMGGLIDDLGVDSVCLNSNTQIGIPSYLDTGITYSWSPVTNLSNSNISNPIATVTQAQTYRLVIQNNSCADTVIHSVFPLETPYSFLDSLGCANGKGTLVFNGNGNYNEFVFSPTPFFTDTLNSNLQDSIVQTTLTVNQQNIYVRAVDNYGCVVQDTASVFVVGFTSSANDTLICDGQQIWLSDTSNSNFVTNYSWLPGTFEIQNNGDSILVHPDSTITYLLVKEYNIGCNDSVNFPITVSQSIPTPLSDVLICNGPDSVSLMAYESSSYIAVHWTDANGDTISADFEFVFKEDNGNYEYNISYVDSIGCWYGDTLTVTKIGFEIQTNADSIICNSDTADATIVNYNLSQLDSVLWQPSSVVFGDSTNMAVKFVADESYNQLSVFGIDTNGCEDTDTVIVLNLSIDEPFLKDTLSCLGDSVQLGIPFDTPNNFTFDWNNGELLSDSTIPNPKTLLQDSTLFSLIISNGVCSDTVSQFVDVIDLQLSVEGDTSYCNFNGLHQLKAITPAGLNIVWSSNLNFNDTLLSGMDSVSFHLQPILGSQTIFTKVTDQHGCSEVDSTNIINYAFNLDYPAEVTLCGIDTVTVEPIGYLNYDSVAFNWSPTANLLSNSTDTIGVIIPPNGLSTIYIASSAANGCSDLDSVQLKISPFDTTLISLSSTADTLISSETAILTVTPSGLSYVWTPVASVASTNLNTAEVNITETTTINVTAFDPIVPACSDDAQYQLTFIDAVCGPPYIFVPNAFTPNGDAENDVLYVRGRNITDLYFAVYNRWGEKVFETEDITVGWDGRYKNADSDPAVFDYYLKCRCAGGQEYFEKGNVTLIR